MVEGSAVILFVILGLGLLGASGTLRWRSPTFKTEATNDRWRFRFFVGWTLLLPIVLFLEVYSPYWFWPKPPDPVTLSFTYSRKVISDVWAAVAVVLAALAWNKP